MEIIQDLDYQASQLQAQGKYLEALEKLEDALLMRRNTFGLESDQVKRGKEKLCEVCIILSMDYLQKENNEVALDLLKRSEMLAQSVKQKVVVFNNLGCYYRRAGQLRVSLGYLEKAQQVSQDNDADTHLNLCAVLSQLDRHTQALNHSRKALILLQEELIDKLSPSTFLTAEQKQIDDQRIAVLAIAYHNQGVEYEFLKRFDLALHSYKKALLFASRFLGLSHAITLSLQEVYETARQEMLEKKEKIVQKKQQQDLFKTLGLPNYSNINISRAATRQTNSRVSTGRTKTGDTSQKKLYAPL